MTGLLPVRLFADAGHVEAQKVLIAAKVANIKITVEPPVSSEAPLELRRGTEVIRYTNAILRHVGTSMQDTSLCGRSFFEAAQVDSWLDWAQIELEDEPPQLKEGIDVLEKHLDQRVFVVGERLTLADISISCSLRYLQSQGLALTLPTATQRWFRTCVEHQAFSEVFKTPVSSAPRGLAAPRDLAPPSAKAGVAESETSLEQPYSRCVGGRVQVSKILLTPDGGLSLVGRKVSVCGWVKTKREALKGQLIFVEINDGSCVGSLQVVIDAGVKGFKEAKEQSGTGASMKCSGELVPSAGSKDDPRKVELQIKGADHEVKVFGGVDAKDYPLAKKHHSMEFLRSIAHLRPRSNFIGAVARVRSALAHATHEFFRSRNFVYVHTPLITAADCEGAGEMFQVTTMMMAAEKEKKCKLAMKDNKIDYSSDFFGKPAFLTVSGQLSVENYCCALSSVYTFGPTFRAENSHTSRHLAEFWMIEPEIAFADIFDDMTCAEEYLKYCVQFALDHHLEDLQFFEKQVEAGLLDRLKNLLAEPFARVTYTEAIEILLKESPKANFEVPVEWGMDLNSEHERYLTEKVKKKPTIVYNYPKGIKAFYMRLNEDNKTVAAMDVLVPQIGEVIGGSQREERLDVLDRRLTEMELDPKDYWWYRDLRRYGSVPHAGFGLGFERLIMLTTGIENIRDVIPYPRYPGHAEF